MLCGGRITGRTDESPCFIWTNPLQTSVCCILVLHVTVSALDTLLLHVAIILFH